MDTVSAKRRSEVMSRVRNAHTGPELAVRSLIHGLDYRFRLHRRDLPCRPDLVFPGRHKITFVHGCFWHRHQNCARARMPKSRVEFWRSKLDGNVKRDDRNERALRQLGWGVMTIWECQTRDLARLATRIRRFLDA